MFEVIGPESHVHPEPSIVVLSQRVAHQQFHESEKVNCLAENYQVISLVKNGISYIQAMND